MIGIAGSLGLLGFFKYADFAIAQFNIFGNIVDLGSEIPLMNLALPIGISFYSFQSISYIIDIYRGSLTPSKTLREYALFVAFFPQLVAGPILRASNFLPQLREKISEVIEVNFKRSGLFNPLKKDSFVQKPDIAHIKPRFEDWKLIKAQALVTGKVTVSEDKLRTEFRLWDVVAAKEMIALAFSTTPENWRRVAHIISDKIYQD